MEYHNPRAAISIAARPISGMEDSGWQEAKAIL
jgi:hypothetical protein